LTDDHRSPIDIIRDRLPSEYREQFDAHAGIDHPEWQTAIGKLVSVLFVDAASKSMDEKSAPLVKAAWHKKAMECLEYLIRLKTLETKQDAAKRPGSMLVGLFGFSSSGGDE